MMVTLETCHGDIRNIRNVFAALLKPGKVCGEEDLSCMLCHSAIDQVHKQNNARVKGDDGAVGLSD